MAKVQNKAVLIVIDGWGCSPIPIHRGDAIAHADTPTMDAFAADKKGYTELEASSEAVGLPEGLMGNSEVGHLNIGAGRVVWQDVVRIDNLVKKNKIPEVPNVVEAFETCKKNNGRLHFLGLVSDGGVHSKLTHLFALLDAAKQHGIKEVYIHMFGDGRDVDPKSGAGHLEDLIKKTQEIGLGKIGTVVGRYYAMDRDKRWERVQVALDGIILGKGEVSEDPVATIRARYELPGDEQQTDEFLKPIIVNGDEARVKDNDTLFFFNYRSDRVREMTQLLGHDASPLPEFPFPENLHITTMTQYNVQFKFPIAFPPQTMDDVLAETLSKQGVKQMHVAETEKYAHVTFFFNGGVEKQFEGEDRDMIASPKVATYDKKPEMSAQEVADQLAKHIAEGKYEFLMNNFAPPDMVGHTGVYEAAVKAVSATDKAIKTVYEACKKHGYTLFVTADHGNAEEMINEKGDPKTAHTCNRVPFVMANAPEGYSLLNDDSEKVLGDVAPTVLALMGLEQPKAMDGRSLLVKA
ncbi:hypothetical protein BJ508DRAFT_371138 [Ascobolus immersus RN42]|uniref:2,3-bisphosphoglycerate-independent phosphoglycerate mutase n=1 Tax=Ascobolus immersus RN42 TaxID=1160509 RepID=A0A3N4HGK6_ASCIM|nr:hypothetical protein BJ508DRAFT_371138 [Ascobolus immersus RN42]